MLGKWSLRGTRRVASHDAARQRLARQRLARLGAGPEPVSLGSEEDGSEAGKPAADGSAVPEAESAAPEPVSGSTAVWTLPAEGTDAAEAPPAAVPGRHAARPLGRRARLWGALSDRLSPTVRSATDGTFSGHHLGVLAVVLATGIAITAWWVLSGRPEQQSVPTVSFGSASPGASAAPETPAASEASASASVSPSVTAASAMGGEVIVDVAGKVRRPGIVTLPPGSRVFDALEAAGGARPGVDLTSLNLARVLVDGEQLLVGLTPAVVPPSPGSTASAGSSATGLVNINTADQVTLETLPGVGPVTAQAILDWRAENGTFTSVDELLEVDGIGEVTLDELRDLVTV